MHINARDRPPSKAFCFIIESPPYKTFDFSPKPDHVFDFSIIKPSNLDFAIIKHPSFSNFHYRCPNCQCQLFKCLRITVNYVKPVFKIKKSGNRQKSMKHYQSQVKTHYQNLIQTPKTFKVIFNIWN